MTKSEILIEVEPIEPKSYKELDLLYENLKEEYNKFVKEAISDGKEYEKRINDISQKLENQEKKNNGLEKTIRKLKDRIGQMDRNMAKTLRAWNKERSQLKSDDSKTNDSQFDTPKDTEKKTKVCEIEKRDKYPWMAVGC